MRPACRCRRGCSGRRAACAVASERQQFAASSSTKAVAQSCCSSGSASIQGLQGVFLVEVVGAARPSLRRVPATVRQRPAPELHRAARSRGHSRQLRRGGSGITARVVGVDALLQFAGVGVRSPSGADHGAAAVAQRQVAAAPAAGVEAVLLVDGADLARAVLRDGFDRVVEHVAVAEGLDAPAAHAGMNVAIALQQVEAFAAIDGVGAVAGLEFVEPVAAQPLLPARCRQTRPAVRRRAAVAAPAYGVSNAASSFAPASRD